MEYTYYIVFETDKKLGWKIFKTSHNMDTVDGFIAVNEDFEDNYGEDVIILSWKRLSTNILSAILGIFV